MEKTGVAMGKVGRGSGWIPKLTSLTLLGGKWSTRIDLSTSFERTQNEQDFMKTSNFYLFGSLVMCKSHLSSL